MEPFPDGLLAPAETNPEARFVAKENITLAFIRLLQCLSPRPRAVLILRDVLEWPASEVADLLDLSVPAVKSAVYRALTTMAAQPHNGEADATAHPRLDEQMRVQLERYV